MTENNPDTEKPRLAGLVPGMRRLDPGAGAMRRRVVRQLRVGLPLLALLILAVLIWRILNPDRAAIDLTQQKPSPEKATGEIEMTGARYEGMDAENRPYTVTAARATRALGQEQVIQLEQLQADSTLGDESWVSATADFGVYDAEKNTLRLSGLVRLFHDSGYALETAGLDMDLARGHAQGDAPVQAQGPDARLEARGIVVENRGEKIVFTGPARLIVRNQSSLIRDKNKG